MELSLRVPLDATVEEPGSVVLPRLAADIVRTMADGPIALEHRANEGVVGVSGGGSSFALNCLQAHDFPELPADEGSGLSVPADILVEAIDRVARAASRDETRPVLTGVLVRLGPDGITLVATDSYRLAVRQTALDTPPAEAVEAIVPARALTEVSRLVGVMKVDVVEVILTETQALFRIGDLRLTSRVIDGQFPDHRQLVPDTFEHDVAFDRAELLAVLTRIGVLAQRNTPVRLAFEPGTVTISATSDPGRRGARVPSGGVLGRGPGGWASTSSSCAPGWRASGATKVRLGLISPLRPGLLRGAEDDYRYLLMPIRLNA